MYKNFIRRLVMYLNKLGWKHELNVNSVPSPSSFYIFLNIVITCSRATL